MKYYKIINDTSLVGLATENDFIKFQPKTKILAFCNFKKGHYIRGFDETFYRDIWMISPITDEVPYQEATITEIPEEEYFLLLDAVRTENEIVDFGVTDSVYMNHFYDNGVTSSEPEIELVPEPTVEYVRSVKLLEMKNASQQAITDGFDITLFDGKTHHFSLKGADQFNILRLKMRVLDGEGNLSYHADGELYKYYSEVDILSIAAEMDKTIDYHNVYYNSLENYINNIEDIEEISAITYGMEIPEEYQSEVLKTLL
jgi:hypothetical protein